MKKNIYFLLLFVSIMTSCYKNEDLKKVELCGNIFEIPNSFQEINIKKSCNSEINFRNKQENEFISFKICGYGNNNGKRQSFESLNLFFHEEYSTLKVETPEIFQMEEEALNKKAYYLFKYGYKNKETFYYTTYVAKENFYLTIKYKSLKNNKQDIKIVKDMINDIDFSSFEKECKENKENCLYCKYPLFW